MEPITGIIVIVGMLYGFYEGRRFERQSWINTFNDTATKGATSTGERVERE